MTGWITDLRKRIEGTESDDIVSGQGSGGRQDFGPSQADQLRGIRRQAELNRSRHSMDTERYDADAPALSENFGEMELRDDGIVLHLPLIQHISNQQTPHRPPTQKTQSSSRQPQPLQTHTSSPIRANRRSRQRPNRQFRSSIRNSHLFPRLSPILNVTQWSRCAFEKMAASNLSHACA